MVTSGKFGKRNIPVVTLRKRKNMLKCISCEQERVEKKEN